MAEPPAMNGELWDLPEASLDLTVVVPYYNPGSSFRSHVERLVAVLESTGVGYEVITVSDGSTDGSAEEIGKLEGIRRVVLSDNRGKGEALRVGLAMGRGRYLGFIDADGDVSPEVFSSFVSLMREREPDIVFGSKRHPMSVVEYPLLRRFGSWTYQQLVRLLFHLTVRDTQCGAKLVRREVLAAVLPRMVEKRFAFDLELFVVARHLGYDRFFEAPVAVSLRFPSTVSPSAVSSTLVETLAVFSRLEILHFYDRLEEPGGPRGDTLVGGAPPLRSGAPRDRPQRRGARP